MPIETFAGKAISNTYQRVVQTDGTYLADGTGSILNNLTLPGNLIISGTLYAQNTVIVTQSFSSGSNQLGDAANDFQTLYGTVRIPTGSLIVTGSLNVSGSSIISGILTVNSSSTIDGPLTVNYGGIVGGTSLYINGNTLHNGGRGITTTGYTYGIQASHTMTGNWVNNPQSAGVYGTGDIGINGQGNIIGVTANTAFFTALSSTSRINARVASSVVQIRGTGTTSATTALLVENSNASASLVVLDNGFVGIGTGSAAYNLDVNGSIRSTSDLFINGGARLRYDGNNNASLFGGINFTSGQQNLVIGTATGFNINTGFYNTLLGHNAGLGLYSGTGNTLIGWSPGRNIQPANSYNSFLGYETGRNADTSYSVFLGYQAGYSETTSNKLYIANSSTTTPLIGGDFSRGRVGINVPPSGISASLHISGSAGTGSALLVYKSGSTVIDVQGSSGQLFSITDSLTGSLFSVNTVAGLPVMEAFSDNTVNIGKYGIYPIKVAATGTLAVVTGSFTGSFIGLFTGSFSGSGTILSASFALSASLSSTASYINPLTQSLIVSGSGTFTNGLIVTGSSSVTGSLTVTGSYTLGDRVTASGLYATSIGRLVTASGDYSFAHGNVSKAIGAYSFAQGVISIAQGNYSHAEGDTTIAWGNTSHAEGGNTFALGNYSHAEGYYTSASADYQHVEGKYNLVNNNALWIVGNGTSVSNRSNIIQATTSSVEITGSLFTSGSGTFTNGLTITGSTLGLGNVFFDGYLTSSQAIYANQYYRIGLARGGNNNLTFGGLGNVLTGDFNTGLGISTLSTSTTVGTNNTAVGYAALQDNTGGGNTAIGAFSMQFKTTGDYNVAVGGYTFNNTSGLGNKNIGIGFLVGPGLTGYENTLIGYSTGYEMTSGYQNIMIGEHAGRGVVTGNGNIVIGPYTTGLPSTLSNTLILAPGGDYRIYSPASTNVIIGSTTDTGEKFQVSGSGKFTNGLTVTGSIIGGLTGSFSGSGLIASSSYSSTASYVNPLTQNVTVIGSILSSGSTSTIPLTVTDGPVGFGAWNKTMLLRSTYPSLIFNSNSSKWTGIGYDYSSGFNIWVNAPSEDVYSTYPKFSIYNNGNVGINNQFPSYTLDISGSTRITNGLTVTGSTYINNYLNVGSTNNIDLYYDTDGRGGMGFGSTINVGNTSVNRNLRILTPTDGGNGTVSIGYFKSGQWRRAFTIDNSPTTPAVWLQPDGGNVTIGTTTDSGDRLFVSGSVKITDGLALTGSLKGKVNTLPTASGTASLDCSLGNFFDLTLSGSYTLFLSASNIQPGQTINLRITQPATSGSLTYGSNFKFAGGISYTASSTGSVVDLMTLISFDSSTLYASALKNLS